MDGSAKAGIGRAALGFCGLAPGVPLVGRTPEAAQTRPVARSASGALRDRRTGRWPLSLIAGNLARTLGARFYAAPESSPPARAPSLTTSRQTTNIRS